MRDRSLFSGCIQEKKQLCFQSLHILKLSLFCTHNVPNRTRAVFALQIWAHHEIEVAELVEAKG